MNFQTLLLTIFIIKLLVTFKLIINYKWNSLDHSELFYLIVSVATCTSKCVLMKTSIEFRKRSV